MEGDEFLHTIPAFCGHFNPLPPHGGRLRCFQNILLMFTFQSTPSAWRETLFRKTILQASSFQSTPSAWRETLRSFCRLAHWNISIHSLRMEGDTHQKSDRKERDISIHSLRMEGDKNFLSMTSCNCIFQSTPSAWRETQERCQIVFPAMDFNPLPPHGGRPFPSMVVIYNGYFNPLPPHGGRLHDAA